MNGQIHYVTDTEGKRIGVLLDMAAYQQLVASVPVDPDLLTSLSEAELQALADSQLTPAGQARLAELLDRQATAAESQVTLSEADGAELDHLLAQIDYLTTLKTRARYTLQQQHAVTS